MLAALAPAAGAAERILSIGGAVTEIVVALGAGAQLVGRDTTSTHPPEVTELPDVGYMRQLSPEGMLSVDPTLILAAVGAGPPETIDVLEATDIRLVTVPDGHGAAALADKIRVVGAALGHADAAAALAERTKERLREVAQAARAQAGDVPPRVMFVLSAQGGRIMASGRDTAADAVIDLAGGRNAVTAFAGYKPLSDEAILAAAPEAIVTMDRGDAAVAKADLMAQPAIAATPAGRAGRVIAMDGLRLLGFGPRTPEAVADLAAALHGR
ncbi:MAG: ABC transporter substrate-binding protein [Alphaproteobacteria bacterium]|jgi:iron complex transport system substrate-binding protein|nr:ABC transporter substrate-binding protein [Alphaproteobacteria bacterium]